MLEKILVSEKELSDINFERLRKALTHIKNNLFDSDNNMYLAFNLLIDINNMITGSNSITQRKVNNKLYRYDKMYIDQDLIKYKLYELIDQFDERKISHRDFHFALLHNIYPFYDGDWKTCKIFFVRGYNFSKDSTTQSKKLMPVTWHSTGWWDWCMQEDKKK